MKLKHKVAAIAAASALALTTLGAAPANATTGTNSLAAVLTADTSGFDKDWSDFDILTAAVLAVLEDNPDSAVKALTEGSTALTAFIPTDRAFRHLVRDLTGNTLKKEANVYAAVEDLGLETVEAVLLYHVVVGPAIDRATAVSRPSGTELTTAQGGKITIRVGQALILRDMSPKLTNPKVFLNRTDINSGNLQLAHAINRVLLPIALSPAHGG